MPSRKQQTPPQLPALQEETEVKATRSRLLMEWAASHKILVASIGSALWAGLRGYGGAAGLQLAWSTFTDLAYTSLYFFQSTVQPVLMSALITATHFIYTYGGWLWATYPALLMVASGLVIGYAAFQALRALRKKFSKPMSRLRKLGLVALTAGLIALGIFVPGLATAAWASLIFGVQQLYALGIHLITNYPKATLVGAAASILVVAAWNKMAKLKRFVLGAISYIFSGKFLWKAAPFAVLTAVAAYFSPETVHAVLIGIGDLVGGVSGAAAMGAVTWLALSVGSVFAGLGGKAGKLVHRVATAGKSWPGFRDLPESDALRMKLLVGAGVGITSGFFLKGLGSVVSLVMTGMHFAFFTMSQLFLGPYLAPIIMLGSIGALGYYLWQGNKHFADTQLGSKVVGAVRDTDLAQTVGHVRNKAVAVGQRGAGLIASYADVYTRRRKTTIIATVAVTTLVIGALYLSPIPWMISLALRLSSAVMAGAGAMLLTGAFIKAGQDAVEGRDGLMAKIRPGRHQSTTALRLEPPKQDAAPA